MNMMKGEFEMVAGSSGNLNMPKISIVTPIYNGIAHTLEYLESLTKIVYPNYEIIIVDDGSTDGSSETIARAFPQVRLLKGDGNLWWSGATNLGIADALSRGTDFILTMNNDVQAASDCLDALCGCACDNAGAIVGGKIYFMDEPNRIWSAGGELSWWNGKTLVLLGHGCADSPGFSQRRKVDFFTGMCVLIPASVFMRIGYYDAIDFPQYHADTEFTLRAKAAGIPLIFEPTARIWNRVESTFMQRFLKHGSLTCHDIKELLTSFRSPMNIKEYWLLHRRFCPLMLLPIAFGLRMLRMAFFLGKIRWALRKGGSAVEKIGI